MSNTLKLAASKSKAAPSAAELQAQLEALQAQLKERDARIEELSKRPGVRRAFGLRELMAKVLEHPSITFQQLEAFAAEHDKTIKPAAVKRALRLSIDFIAIAKEVGRWTDKQ